MEKSKKLKKVYSKDKIAHFPVNLPKDAQNVQFYMSYNLFWGTEDVVLRYTMDNEYISERTKIYERAGLIKKAIDAKKIPLFKDIPQITQYKVYVFDDKNNENYIGTFLYGVAINAKEHTIIYFYTNHY